MTQAEFHCELDRLDLSLNGLARALEIDVRNVRRWASGQRDVPEFVAGPLRLAKDALDLEDLIDEARS